MMYSWQGFKHYQGTKQYRRKKKDRHYAVAAALGRETETLYIAQSDTDEVCPPT